jgi:hypothetical protein
LPEVRITSFPHEHKHNQWAFLLIVPTKRITTKRPILLPESSAIGLPFFFGPTAKAAIDSGCSAFSGC